MPQRLACLDGPRQRCCAATRPRTRTSWHRFRNRHRRNTIQSRRSHHRSLRQWLRHLPVLHQRQCTGLSHPNSTRIYPVGFLRGICFDRERRLQPDRATRCNLLFNGSRTWLSLRYRLSRVDRPRTSATPRMGRHLWLRGSRTVCNHDRQSTRRASNRH